MAWYWWLLALLLLPGAWFALKVITSFATPQSSSGAALLKQELRKRGVPCENLNAAFYAECIEWAERVAMVEGRGSTLKRKASFVESLETMADMAQLWVREPDSTMFKQHGNSPSMYRAIFERHKVGNAG
jgi:hypothetical protein